MSYTHLTERYHIDDLKREGYSLRARHCNAHPRPYLMLRDTAKQHLVAEQWSPEQIAGRLKLEGRKSISHATIYQRIFIDKKAGGDLYTHLRSKNKRRKRYGSNRTGRGIIPSRY